MFGPLRSAAPRGCHALALALALIAASAHAEDSAPTAEEPPDLLVDQAHDAVAGGLDDIAQWFDDFFGEACDVDGLPAGAHLDLILETFRSGVSGEDRTRLRVRGAAALPRFENRLRLVVDSDADAALTGRDLAGIEPQPVQRARDAGGLGLSFILDEDPRHVVAIGAGIAGGFSPELVVNARYRFTQPFGESFRAAAAPTLYWRSERGPGLGVAATLDWADGEDDRWRAGLFADYEDRDGEIDWSGQLSWSRRLDERGALSARIGLRGEADAQDAFGEVWTSLRLRRSLGRPWLFVEIEPGLSWHERADFDVEPFVALRLEAQFRTPPPVGAGRTVRD